MTNDAVAQVLHANQGALLQVARSTAHVWLNTPDIRDAVVEARPDAMAVDDWDWLVLVAYARQPYETAQSAAQRLRKRVALSVERYGRPMAAQALLDASHG